MRSYYNELVGVVSGGPLISRYHPEDLLAVCRAIHLVFPCDSGKNKNGTAITVVQSCTVCHFDRTWASQPKLGRLYVGNVATSAALLFSGNQFAKVARLFNLMHVPFISKTTFQTYQNNLLFPVIIDAWETDQPDLFQQGKDLDSDARRRWMGRQPGPLCQIWHIHDDGAEGWADSPGHCAKYGTYTMMELRLGKVIHVQLVQVKLRKRCM